MSTIKRVTRNINRSWLYCPTEFCGNIETVNMTAVNLPHSNKQLHPNYFDQNEFCFKSTYFKTLDLTKQDIESRCFIEFEGVMTYADVYVNSVLVGSHKGGYTQFKFEITEYVKVGQNAIVVAVDSSEREEIPPFGYSIDYLTFGGIYRDVDVITVPSAYIEDVFAKPKDCLLFNKSLDVDVTINSTQQECGEIVITLEGEGVCEAKTFKVDIKAGDNKFSYCLDNLKNVELWDINTPTLYDINVSYISSSSEDSVKDRIGFRQVEFTNKGFMLNGIPLKLFGLNRHQSYPCIGYAAPKRLQEMDADILKYELGLNLVRASHYPQSKYFLSRCDEIGLMVFEEIPGWQHIGDQAWQEVSIQNVREMITAHKNHPSIILWGVRINESQDCHDFYVKTNALAKSLDNTRQTGGVRCIDNSELLEDVYTMNDFVFTGNNTPCRQQQKVTGLDKDVPYLITEFGGHMHPTKSYDCEERAISHTERHMLVHNELRQDESISGGIGWCAFDYNTHSNFGSGDKICHHGVMDMFRLPKMASYFYKSQRDPKYGAVLEPATRWTVGDRSIGGISPLYVFTNCDYIEVEVRGTKLGRYYPNKDEFAGIEFAPCLIRDFNVAWGESWGSSVFKGYINDTQVIERKFTDNPLPEVLSVKADSDVLDSDGSDMTRVVVKILDSAGNHLPYIFTPLQITVKGAGELVGDNLVSTQAGVYAFFVKNNGESGKIAITVTNPLIGSTKIKIDAK